MVCFREDLEIVGALYMCKKVLSFLYIYMMYSMDFLVIDSASEESC